MSRGLLRRNVSEPRAYDRADADQETNAPGVPPERQVVVQRGLREPALGHKAPSGAAGKNDGRRVQRCTGDEKAYKAGCDPGAVGEARIPGEQ
jgi:hypothetical protein